MSFGILIYGRLVTLNCFFVFSLLLPLKYYWRSALPYFPSFALLINIFTPVLLFLIGQNILNIFKKIILTEKAGIAIKEKIIKMRISLQKNYPSYLKMGFGFLSIFMVFQIINQEFRHALGQFGQWQVILLLFIMAIRKFLSNILKKTWVLVLFFSATVIYLMAGQFLFSQPALLTAFYLIKNSIVFMLVFAAASGLLSRFQEQKKKHMPFAFFAFLGVIITILLEGSAISLIIRFFNE